MRALAVLSLFALPVLSAPVAAQSVLGVVSSDLDKSGGAETFTLLDNGQGLADFQIDDTALGTQFGADVAWVGGPGQIPWLELAPNGSVQIISGNDAIGRDRWNLTLTIAYRDGEYRVAGYTYIYRDTLDLANNLVCDVNLLSGKGEVSFDGGPKQTFKTDEFATPITSWSQSSFGPNENCFPR
ncbi:MAG: hypothetical protein NTX73_17345 [Rhodobacterales bacterium]|jgi:hypothetical protein|nr:hypothetical protein [Rhodobacterales bacterium]